MRDEGSQNANYESPKERKHEHDTREFTGFVPQQQKSFLLFSFRSHHFSSSLFRDTTAIIHIEIIPNFVRKKKTQDVSTFVWHPWRVL